MAERTLIEQLDQAVQALLDRPHAAAEAAAHAPAEAEVAALARVAAELRHLPSAAFRARLKSELERRSTMTATPAKKSVPFREGFHTVTPYLVVERPEEFLAFLKQAFGAEETFRAPGSAGGVHVELRIGDSMVMAGGAPGFKGTPSAIHLYVRDADAVYERALNAGATSFFQPIDRPYGERQAGVRDGFGNSWYVATHLATGHKPPGMGSVTPYLHLRGADTLLDFMKQAFAAEESFCERAPDGSIRHAKVRIGDSLVEMGEAHGPIEPTASMLLLSVDDADEWYRRAVAAGAESLSEPADQPYGDRVGAVRDTHGNKWYMGTPIQK